MSFGDFTPCQSVPMIAPATATGRHASIFVSVADIRLRIAMLSFSAPAVVKFSRHCWGRNDEIDVWISILSY